MRARSKVVGGFLALCLCGLGVGGPRSLPAQGPAQVTPSNRAEEFRLPAESDPRYFRPSEYPRDVSRPAAAATAQHGGGARSNKEVDHVEAVTGVVSAYYANVSRNDPGANLGLFVSPDTQVVGISKGEGAERIWRLTAREMIAAQRRETQVPATVEATRITLLDETLATAEVAGHSQFVKFRATLTLTAEGGRWRIASMVYQTRFRHQP